MLPRPSLDDLRVARPDLSFALFAMDPGGEVTLEIYSDGRVFSFKGPTEADAILAAFPPDLEDMPHEPATPDSVFD